MTFALRLFSTGLPAILSLVIRVTIPSQVISNLRAAFTFTAQMRADMCRVFILMEVGNSNSLGITLVLAEEKALLVFVWWM